MVAAFCLTEAGAGSDAASIRTRAAPDGDDWILDGEKIWISNGGLASFFTVFAKTPPDRGKAHMTAFIVTRDMPGVSTGRHEDKMGTRAWSTTTVRLESVRVPRDNVLGEVGGGFQVAMKILNNGRTGLGGASVGAMKHLIALSARQANERVQFGKPIAEFGLVKQKVGHMVVECYASEAVVGMVAGLIDRGYEDYAVEAAISKVFATECLWRTADEALQIAGGNGYMREFPYERILRDVRVFRIFEGTNEILRLFIALTAMKTVGTQLKELASSLHAIFDDPIKGFGVLSEYALKRAALATGIDRGKNRFTKLDPALKEQAGVFEHATGDLASAADRILRKHGRNIVEKQFATRRLADIMIDLFALACVLSRVDSSLKEKGAEAAENEIEILQVFAGQVQHRVTRNFGKIDDNDDELVKSLADHAFAAEGFGWDSV
jgi:alkylation response protein AidB-like acyl-CoA dehydrogenase